MLSKLVRDTVPVVCTLALLATAGGGQTPTAGVPPAGTIPLANLAPGAREAFFAALDASQTWSAMVADQHLTKALALDSTFGLARVVRAAWRNGPTVAWVNAEYKQGFSDAAARPVPELTYALGQRAAGVNATRLLAAARAMFPNDRRIAFDHVWSMTGTARLDSLRALNMRFPDFAAPRMALAYALTINEFVVPTGDVATEALSAAQEAVKLAPSLAGTHLALGHVLQRLGRWDEAQPHLNAATKIDPAIEYAYELKAEIALRDGKPNAVARARVALDSNRMTSPNITRSSNARRNASMLAVHEGKVNEMLADHIALAREAAANGAPGYGGETLARLAVVVAGTGDARAAEGYLADAKRTFATATPLMGGLEFLTYALLKQTQPARRALEAWQALLPVPLTAAAQRETVCNTAMVLLAEGKYAEAIAETKKPPVTDYTWCDFAVIEATAGLGRRAESDSLRAAYLARKNINSSSLMYAVLAYRAKFPVTQ